MRRNAHHISREASDAEPYAHFCLAGYFVGFFWKSGEKLERIKPAGCVKPFGTSVNEQNKRTEAKDEFESDDETRESWSFSTGHRVPRAHSQVLEYPTTGVISCSTHKEGPPFEIFGYNIQFFNSTEQYPIHK